MIKIRRRGGRALRIGHRGAAALAPANTLPSLRAALEVGVDLIEFDVVSGSSGALVVAHSSGEIESDTPELDDVLAFFVDEAPDTGLHVDLKEFGLEARVAEALQRHGVAERSFVSSVYLRSSRRLAGTAGIRTGITIPRAVLGISEEGRGAPLARAGLRVLRRLTPFAIRPLLAISHASAVVMHHSLVTERSVRAVHARGAAVVTWTVDDPSELERVDEAGVDAVVTNDPRLFPSD